MNQNAIDSTTKFIWKNTYGYNYYGIQISEQTEFIAIYDTSKNPIQKS
jgi:hypothetical protein